MDEILTKLKDALLENGVAEELVNDAFAKAMAEPEVVEEAPAEEPAPEEIPEEALAEEVPEEAVEEPLPEEPLPEEAPVEEVPAEPVAPQIPPELLEQLGEVESLKGEVEELKKANEALLARMDSLNEALKSAGVIEGEVKPLDIGIHQPSALGNNPVDDPMEDVLAKINKRGF